MQRPFLGSRPKGRTPCVQAHSRRTGHALCAGLIAALVGGCADPGYQGYLNEDEPFGYYSVGAGNPYAGTGYYDYGGPYSPYYYYGMLYGPYGMGGYWGDPYVGGGNGGRHR